VLFTLEKNLIVVTWCRTQKIPTATKKSSVHKPTLRDLNRKVSQLSSRVEELEDLRDLNAAIARNQGKSGVEWSKAKTALGLD
jgi:hypothetical protein